MALHCCRLQAIYSPITGKNFVTVYTAFDPWKRGNLLLRLQKNILVIVLKSVISIVDYLYFRGQIHISFKYFVINSTGKNSMYTFVTQFSPVKFEGALYNMNSIKTNLCMYVCAWFFYIFICIQIKQIVTYVFSNVWLPWGVS